MTQHPQQPLIVDHFAGGGGASTGITLALGVAPRVAINHSPTAIAIHAANHPGTIHLQEDITTVCPVETTGGAQPDLLWTSPSCTHFSKAKGAKTALDPQLRALPWTATDWAATVRPRVILVENVHHMRTWGPLDSNGAIIESRAGETYQAWLQRFRDLGYVVEDTILNAADFGAPTRRIRLFIQARCDGNSITWPEPTHGPGLTHPHIAISGLIDWSNLGGRAPGPRKGRNLGANTMRRLHKVLERHGEIAPNGNLAAMLQYNGASIGHAISLPLGTLTTKDRFAVVQRTPSGDLRHRFLTVAEMLAAQGFPADYQLPTKKDAAVEMIGNSVCPQVAAAVVRAAMSPPPQQNAAD